MRQDTTARGTPPTTVCTSGPCLPPLPSCPRLQRPAHHSVNPQPPSTPTLCLLFIFLPLDLGKPPQDFTHKSLSLSKRSVSGACTSLMPETPRAVA